MNPNTYIPCFAIVIIVWILAFFSVDTIGLGLAVLFGLAATIVCIGVNLQQRKK